MPKKIMMPKNLILVASIGKPHGVKGECYLHSYTHPPDSVLTMAPLQDSSGKTLTIKSWRKVDKGFLVMWEGYDDRTAVEKILHGAVFIDRQFLPPAPAGHYYQHDMIGFNVVGEDGQTIGTVAGFSNYGAGDILVIKSEQGEEKLLPFQSFAVKKIDEAKRSLSIVAAFLT